MLISDKDIRMILNKAEKYMMHGIISGDFYSEVIVPHKSGLYCVSVSQSADDIVEEAAPLILGGDFNTTDQSQTYRLFDHVLRNAHWQAGWGFGFTYPTTEVKFLRKIYFPPLVRIDHIFYSKHFAAKRAVTLSDSGGSDHFPIIAELILKNQ